MNAKFAFGLVKRDDLDFALTQFDGNLKAFTAQQSGDSTPLAIHDCTKAELDEDFYPMSYKDNADMIDKILSNGNEGGLKCIDSDSL